MDLSHTLVEEVKTTMSALFGPILCVEGFSANKFHVKKQSMPWQGQQRWMTRAHLLSTLRALISPTT